MTNVNILNYPTTVTTFNLVPPAAAQPCCSAALSASVTNATGDGTAYDVPFDTVLVDQTGSMNTSTGVYTFPVAGLYVIAGSIYLANIGSANKAVATLGGNVSVTCMYLNPNKAGNGSLVMPYNCIFSASAGNTVKLTLTVSGTTKTVTVGGGSQYSNTMLIWMVS